MELLCRFINANRFVSDKSGKTFAPALFAGEEEARKAGIGNKAFVAAMKRLFQAGTIWKSPTAGRAVAAFTSPSRGAKACRFHQRTPSVHRPHISVHHHPGHRPYSGVYTTPLKGVVSPLCGRAVHRGTITQAMTCWTRPPPHGTAHMSVGG